jgi:signal transduction histidine kinase
MRILLIEDTLAYFDEFAAILADSRIEVDALERASTGDEGARMMALGLHDIYFVDYRLPGSDGLTLVRDARAAGLLKPIIVLTGFDSEEIDYGAQRAGANDYLEKGKFSPEMLNRVIRYAVSNASNARLLQANAALERLTAQLTEARQRADEASAAKTRFVASVSHELRTPLNGILGYVELLRIEGGLTPMQADRVEKMQQAGRHLLELISSVLDLSKIETGPAVQAAPMDVRRVVDSCLDMVRPSAAAKGLKLIRNVMPDVPQKLFTDAGRLRQVLLNLLGNAVKFTAAGSIEVRIYVPPAKAVLPGAKHVLKWVRFDVRDTGPGIPPERQQELFQPYRRLSGTSDQVEGAGLGLSLARQFAALMGGCLGYDPVPAGGSNFWLELPLTEDQGEVADDGDAGDHVGPNPIAPSRVLVVDDVGMSRNAAASLLRSAGYDVVCAETGRQAVEAVAQNDYLAVFMDLRMPDVDGIEATRRIRSLAAPRGLVPIVGLSGHAFTDQVEACRHAGMTTHVSKPFTQAALMEALARCTTGADLGAASADALPPSG